MLTNTPSSTDRSSLIALTIALVALSLAAIFIKLSEQELGPAATVFNRLWIATIVLTGWNWSYYWVTPAEPPSRQWPDQSDIGQLILVGILGTASVMCWAYSLTQTSVANSTLMRNLSPVFTALQGWLWFQQSFDRRFLVGMGLALVGASLVGMGDFQVGLDHLTGDILGLLAAVFYALNLLILEQLRAKFSAVTLLSWRCGIGAIGLIPLVWFTEGHFFPSSPSGWLVVIALAVVCQCFGQCLLVHYLKQVSSSFIAVFLLLEPTLTAVFAWWLFAETLNPLNLLAFGLVLWGIFLARTSQHSSQPTLQEIKPQ